MTRVLKGVAASSVGLLLASALTALLLRVLDKKVSPELQKEVDELVYRIDQAMADETQREEAEKFLGILNDLSRRGIHVESGEDWDLHFTAVELIRLRLNALAHGKPSQASLVAMEHIIVELQDAADVAGLNLPPSPHE